MKILNENFYQNRIKEFLNDMREFILKNDFDSVYQEIFEDANFQGAVTEFLINKAGINPLEFMDIVPNFFAYGSKIKTIHIPDHITYIGPCAFEGSSIESINLHNGIKNIPDECFAWSQLKEIRLPYDLKKIAYRAFAGCLIEEIHLPHSLEEIEDSVFAECDNLTKIYYDGTKYEWDNLIGNWDIARWLGISNSYKHVDIIFER